jgi:hypothetical protein
MSPRSEERVRENRLRRAAARQGLQLAKSRARDPKALGFGTYALMNPQTNAVVHADHTLQSGYGLTLDGVEAWLTR